MWTYLESRASVVDPADDEISVLKVSAGWKTEDQVAEGAHLHLKCDLALVDWPVYIIVGVQTHPVHPSGVGYVGGSWSWYRVTGRSPTFSATHQGDEQKQLDRRSRTKPPEPPVRRRRNSRRRIRPHSSIFLSLGKNLHYSKKKHTKKNDVVRIRFGFNAFIQLRNIFTLAIESTFWLCYENKQINDENWITADIINMYKCIFLSFVFPPCQ